MWESSRVLDFGQRPIPSPDGQMLAFASEETQSHAAGIYLMRQGSVIQLTDGSPPHSWDYTWSPDSRYIAFSAPGQPGTESAGIWMIDMETGELQQLWDRGSAPSWDSEDPNFLYCAGPEDGTENEGIFRINLSFSTRIRLYEQGKAPRMSSDRKWLAFQIPRSDTQTPGLFLLSMDSLKGELIAYSVGDFCWLFDSRQIVYESVGGGSVDLFIVSVNAPHLPQLLVAQAAAPASFVQENTVVFVRLSGDESVGIWTLSVEAENPQSLNSTGSRPQPSSDGGSIYFDDLDGIYVLRRVS
jgi:Tol biopolymer transport system component